MRMGRAAAFWCWQQRIPRDALVERLARFDALQSADAEALRAIQCGALRETVEHAAARVPFYADTFASMRLSPADVATPETLARLPILDRQRFADAGARLLTPGPARGLRYAESGGTSGRPVRTPHDEASRISVMAARGRALGWYGAALWDRPGFLVSQRFTPARRVAIHLRDRLLGRRRNATFGLDRAESRRVLAAMSRFRPTTLIGQASLTFRLAHFAREWRCDAAAWGVRVALVNGELLTPYMDRVIQDVLHCPVLDEYGCTEIGSIAHRCPSGTLHLNPEHVIVELVDADGRPVPPGQPGRVILTGLHNRAMPLIRYDVGDWAVRAESPCPCGRQPGLSGLRVVAGRTRDIWRDAVGHPVVAHAVVGDLQTMFAASGYWSTQWVQRSAEEIEVRMEPHGEPPSDLLEAASDGASSGLGWPMRVTWRGAEVEWTRGGKLSSMLRRAGE